MDHTLICLKIWIDIQVSNGQVQCLQSATLIYTLSHCGWNIGLCKHLSRYMSELGKFSAFSLWYILLLATLIYTLSHCGWNIGLCKNLSRYMSELGKFSAFSLWYILLLATVDEILVYVNIWIDISYMSLKWANSVPSVRCFDIYRVYIFVYRMITAFLTYVLH